MVRQLLRRPPPHSWPSASEASHGRRAVCRPAHADLARLHNSLNDPFAALEALQKAIDILVIRADGAPAPAEPDQVLAALHHLQGELLEALPGERCEGGSCAAHALQAYQRALAHNGEHAQASAAVRRLEETQQQGSEADERTAAAV